MDVDAIVLVGGKGTRLRPLTLSAPKPMLPTAGVPFLEHQLSRIREAGITHVVLGTSYKAEVFSDYFGDGSGFGLDIEYVVESSPLGTGGAIRNVAPLLRHDTSMIFNGDVLSGLDLGDLLQTHQSRGADATLQLMQVADPRAFGCVPTDEGGWVTEFLEKTDSPPTNQINAGCYVFSREVLESIPAGRVVSVERETFPSMLGSGAKVAGHVDSSYWLDLGTPNAFVQGSTDLVQGAAPTGALPGRPGPWLALEGAQIGASVVLSGGTTVGRGAHIGDGAHVVSSVVFDRARIGPGAVVARSIIGADAVIGAGAVVVDAVIGDDAMIGEHCELRHGIRVWPGVSLPTGGVRFSADL